MPSTKTMTRCSMLPAAALMLTGLSVTAEAGYRHGGHAGWSPNEPAMRADGLQVPGGCPIESPTGRFLFTARNPNDDPDTGLDIWVNQRAGHGPAFAPGDRLPGPVNVTANDFCPTPLPDGELFFVSNRDPGDNCGSADLYRTINNPATGWAEPENLGCHPHGPNTPGLELSPAVIETVFGTFLFYSTDYHTGNQDIYVSYQRGDGTFSPGERLGYPINTEYDDQQPNVSQDGREIVFASNRPSYSGDESGFDVFTAKRRFAFFPWRRVVNLSESVPFDTVDGDETRPSLSWDGERLYYGIGGLIYVSERNDYRRPFWAR